MTEEEYDRLASGFTDLTGGAQEISHAAWTEAFSAMYGEEEKDLAAYFEAIFSALDVDKNDSISVSFFFLLQPLFRKLLLFFTWDVRNSWTSTCCSRG